MSVSGVLAHIIHKFVSNSRRYSIGADSFADSQIHCDNKEAKSSEVPKAFGTENERKYSISGAPQRNFMNNLG
jgi:hypothetical protein